MNKQNTEALIRKYPTIFKVGDPREPFQMFQFECGDGWAKLIDHLCQQMEQHLTHECTSDFAKEFRIVQVKEKLGRLRVYTNIGDAVIFGLVDTAEVQSRNVCENCGSNEGVLLNNKGTLVTLCANCKQYR